MSNIIGLVQEFLINRCQKITYLGGWADFHSFIHTYPGRLVTIDFD